MSSEYPATDRGSKDIDLQTENQEGFETIYVGPKVQVQSPQSRYGAHITEELDAFIHDSPNVPSVFDTSDDEDDLDSPDDAFEPGGAESVDIAWDDQTVEVEALFWQEYLANGAHAHAHAHAPATGDQAQSQPVAQNHQQQAMFPRGARYRLNLTALSQNYNLYFAAYQDKIHVFQPKRALQILPPPCAILQPKRSEYSKRCPGAVDRSFPHQINHMMVGNLGHLEIVLFCFDDGDVGAYYTQSIVRYLEAVTEARTAGRPQVHPPAVPREFFHDSVRMSAWGLAIHQQSRLIGISSNRFEVTVFAFAFEGGATTKTKLKEDDNAPKLWGDMTSVELERHIQSRTRTWRIVLPLSREGNNIPGISFADDEFGNAEKVVAVDILGNTWILDIWKIWRPPVLHAPITRAHQRNTGWSVLVLPDSSFKSTKTIRECLGVPADQLVRVAKPKNPSREHRNLRDDDCPWIDISCGLWYVKDLAGDPSQFLRERNGTPLYNATHSQGNHLEIVADNEPPPLSPQQILDEEGDSEDWETGSSANEYEEQSDHGLDDGDPSDRGGSLDASQTPASDNVCKELDQEVQLARDIVPYFAQVDDPLDEVKSNTSSLMSRQRLIRASKLCDTELPPHLANEQWILRCLTTDIELMPFGFTSGSAGIVCKSALIYHDQHRRRRTPHDMVRSYSERISMLLHVPELNLVVAGSLHGRVALLTLTKTEMAKRVGGDAIRRGFRIDCVLPRKEEEQRKVRPWCTLHGVSISPVPQPRARGLDLKAPAQDPLRPPRGEPKAPPAMYRLVLHYLDHTILMYDICRRALDPLEDLMIF